MIKIIAKIMPRLGAGLATFLDVAASIFVRVTGAVGGFVVGLSFLIYRQAYMWPIDIAWYWILLVATATGLLIPQYFAWFGLWVHEVSIGEPSGPPAGGVEKPDLDGCIMQFLTGTHAFAFMLLLFQEAAALFSGSRVMGIVNFTFYIQIAFAILIGVFIVYGAVSIYD